MKLLMNLVTASLVLPTVFLKNFVELRPGETVATYLRPEAYWSWGLLRSIEGAYITIIRYMPQHGASVRWFPLWYPGIPSQNTYPPFYMTRAGPTQPPGVDR